MDQFVEEAVVVARKPARAAHKLFLQGKHDVIVWRKVISGFHAKTMMDRRTTGCDEQVGGAVIRGDRHCSAARTKLSGFPTRNFVGVEGGEQAALIDVP